MPQNAHHMHTFSALSMNGLSLVSDCELFSRDLMFQFYRHNDICLQQSVPIMPWVSLFTLYWFLPQHFLSQVHCLLLSFFVCSSGTYFALLHAITPIFLLTTSSYFIVVPDSIYFIVIENLTLVISLVVARQHSCVATPLSELLSL